MPDRRKIVRAGLASLSVASGLVPAITVASSTVNARARLALGAFLDQTLITKSMRCGTRRGDGVPDESDVRLFLEYVLELAMKGQAQISQALTQEVRRDHEASRTMVIDGWVYARTEALAAAALMLLLERDCRLTNQTGG